MMFNHRTLWHIEPFKRGVLITVALTLAALMLALVGMSLPTQAAPLLFTRGNLDATPPPYDSKDDVPSGVEPGELITYVFETRETGSTPYDLVARFDLAPGLALSAADPTPDAQGGDVQNGLILTWTVTGIEEQYQYFTVTAQVPATATLGKIFFTEASFESDHGSGSDEVEHRVLPPVAKSNTTEISATLNGLHEAVAGEVVTTTVVYTIPAGTTAYSLTPRIQLDEGLYPYDADPMWTELLTDSFDNAGGQDTIYELRYGDPFTVENEAAIVETYTIYARVAPTETGGDLINNNYDLMVRPILRWTPESTGTIDESGNSPYLIVNELEDLTFRRPGVEPYPNNIEPDDNDLDLYLTYLDPLGQGEGGGRVEIIIPNENQQNHAPAYENVFTATLSPGLSFVSADPAPDPSDIWTTTVGGPTYVRWAVSEITDALPVNITAILPDHLNIGELFSVTGEMHQESFASDPENEGLYSESAYLAFRPGLISDQMSKSGSVTDSMTIGEYLTYTIAFTQPSESTLYNPTVVDTLDAGFHYVPETLVVEGQPMTPTVAAGDNGAEVVTWEMETFTTEDNPQVIEATYRALLDGIGTDATFAFGDGGRGENSAVLSWLTNPGDPASTQFAEIGSYEVDVIEPDVEGIRAFNNGQETFYKGQTAPFAIEFKVDDRNAPAYDVEICQELPPGVVFEYEDSYTQGTCGSDYVSPAPGAMGTICWTIDKVCADDDMKTLAYVVSFGEGILAGSYAPETFVREFTSLPGYDPDERRYSEVIELESIACDGGNCPFTIRGLGISQTSHPMSVNPGDVLTYTIAYSNTTLPQPGVAVTYTDLSIISIYDPYLTVLDGGGATDEDGSLTWNVPPVTPGAYHELTFTTQVAAVLQGVYELTNTLTWNSAQTPPATDTLKTPVKVARPSLDLTSPVTQTYAGETLIYTVYYTNSGSAAKPYTFTFDYDDHVTYDYIVDSVGTLSEVSPTTFVDSDVAPDDSVSRTLQIAVLVDEPLPYALEELMSSVTVESPGADPDADSLTTDLLRPRFDPFNKTSSIEVAPEVSGTGYKYSFELVNSGDLTATNCILTDTWDTNLVWDTANNDWVRVGAGENSANPIPPYNNFEIAPGEAISIPDLQIEIGTLSDHYENFVAISCDQVNKVPMAKHDLWAASVETYKTLLNDVIAFPGREVRYHISYTNTAGTFTGPVITDTLPPELDFAGCSAPGDWVCENDAGIVTWVQSDNVLNLSESTGTLEVWGTVSTESVDEGKRITNTTASDSSVGEVPYRPGTVDVVTRISRPRLTLTQSLATVNQPPHNNVAPEDTIRYQFTYKNRGTAEALNVVVEATLPTDVVSHKSGGTLSGDTVSWNVGNLQPGEEGTLSLIVEAKDVADGSLVTFDAGDITIHSDRIQDSDADAETIYAYPLDAMINDHAIAVSKIADYTTPLVSDNYLTYTIYYTNVGGGVLHNIIISDVLDSHLEAIEAPGCTHTHNYDGTSGGTILCSINEDLDQENNSGSVYVVTRLRGVDENTVIPNTPWASTVETGWQEGETLTIGGTPPLNPTITILDPQPPYVAPQTVEIFGEVDPSSTGPVTLKWDFGNGETAVGGRGYDDRIATTYNLSGTYTVVMTATNIAGEAIATKVITVTGEPEIDVAPAAITESEMEGYTAFTKTFTISNTAAATDRLNWEVAKPAETWLSVQSAITSGSLLPGEAAQVVMHIAEGLTPAEYTSDIIVTSNDVDVTVPVTFTVEADTELNVTPDAFTESANAGAAAFTRPLTITNGGTTSVDWTVAIAPTVAWLDVTPTSGATLPGAQSVLTVTFDAAAVDLGTETFVSLVADLIITSDGADITVPVTFEITAEEGNKVFLPLVVKQ